MFLKDCISFFLLEVEDNAPSVTEKEDGQTKMKTYEIGKK